MNYCNGTMKDVKVENVQSLYGMATGISIYKGTKVELQGTFEIDTIVAGAALTEEEISDLTLPNAEPYVCSIRIGDNTWTPGADSDVDTKGDGNTDVEIKDKTTSVSSSNIYGSDSCPSDKAIGDIKIEGLRIEYEGEKKRNTESKAAEPDTIIKVKNTQNNNNENDEEAAAIM